MAASKGEIIDRLRVLERRGGKLTPRRVLKDAKDPESPLHHWKGWTWDIEKAAEEYWMEQSRTLLATFTYPVEDRDSNVVRVALYMRDPDKGPRDQGYIRTAVLATRREKSLIALRQELTRAVGHIERVCTLAVGLKLEAEAQGVRDSLNSLRKAL